MHQPTPNPPDVEASLTKFTAAFTRSKTDALQRHATLQQLGLDGEDAFEFMKQFSEQFQVDMHDYNFAKHFGPEMGFNPVAFLVAKLFRKKSWNLELITLARLVEAAVTKKWR
jgi:hypothetical protein